MANGQNTLSYWFYLGIFGIILGVALICCAKGRNKSKLMENGYFALVLGMVGVISEWTDFATVLFIFTLTSGFILLLDKIICGKKTSSNRNKPHYVHYAKEFFPVVLSVWVLRAFLFEAYQIPSSSMRPDLSVGDFILVNKFTYGIREPFSNKVLININQVKRGDVVVFKDPNVYNRDLIKRVVAVGGDHISYFNKKLVINGQALAYTPNGKYSYVDDISPQQSITFNNNRYIEDLLGVKHNIITWDQVPPLFFSQVTNFKERSNCNYQDNNGFSCIVPNGYYFMMGDNRDNSFDSRYWGFVSNNAILGKAIYVWMNFHDFSRIGTKI